MASFRHLSVAALLRPGLVIATMGGLCAPASSANAFAVPEVTFDPPFVVAEDRPQRVEVRVEPGGELPERLQVAYLRPLVGEGEEFDEIFPLRRAGSGAFVGTLRFDTPVCGVHRLRLLDPLSGETSPIIKLPSARPYLPTAVFQDEQIIGTPEDDFDPPTTIRVPVEGPGRLILTVDDATDTRGGSLKVTLSPDDPGRETVLEVRQGGCVEHFIDLDDHTRALAMRIEGDFDKRAALRLDAVADRLELRTLGTPSTLGGAPLVVEASVAALGLPVPATPLLFRLREGRGVERFLRTTDNDGVAELVIDSGSVGRGGTLEAELTNAIDPVLSVVDGFQGDHAVLDVVPAERAEVGLSQPARSLDMTEGERTIVDLAVQVNVAARERFVIDLAADVVPKAGARADGLGVNLSRKVLRGVGPQTFAIQQNLRAERSGAYDLYVDALVRGSREGGATAGLAVNVAGDEDEELVIYAPVSEPAILDESDLGSGPVVFKAAVAGTVSPPDRLFLDQLFESQGESGVELVPERIAVLSDDGSGPDEIAGDLIFTGTAPVFGSSSARNRYWASTDTGQHSAPYTFEIVSGSFPQSLVPPSETDDIVEEEGTGDRFVADQLLVKFRDDIAPDDILGLIESEFGTPDRSAELIGFEPVFDVAQVQFTFFDGSSDLDPARPLRNAETDAAALSEVEAVEPNHAIVLAQAAGFPDLVSLGQVRAPEAWLGAGANPTPANRRNVAVLDSEVDHPQLNQHVINRKLCTAGPDNNRHGTKVAGIVKGGLTGADQGRFLLPVTVYAGNANLFSAVICGLGHVAQNFEDARIINLSLGFNSNQLSEANFEKTELSQRIFGTIEQQRGILVVAAAGNANSVRVQTIEFFPAAFPGRGLIAVSNVDADDRPFDGPTAATRRGPWVDLSAPGVRVQTLLKGGGTTFGTGTSFSAPLVAAAASILWSRNPSATPWRIEQLLEQGVADIGVLNVGVGRLDSAEAVVNGSVELPIGPAPGRWRRLQGNCRAAQGSPGARFYKAQHGERFIRCDSGSGLAVTDKIIEVPPNTRRLVVRAQIAGFARAAGVRLDVRFRTAGRTERWWLNPPTDPARCRGFKDNGNATRCTGWQTATITIPNPAEGASRVIFRARNRNQEPVSLLVDSLTLAAR